MLQNQDQTREMIVDSCRRQLQSGRGTVSLRAVAAGCGMGVSTLYGYFENKDALLRQVLEQDWAALAEELSASMTSGNTPRENLRQLRTRIFAFQRRYPSGTGRGVELSGTAEAPQKKAFLAGLIRRELERMERRETDAARIAEDLAELALTSGGASLDVLWESVISGLGEASGEPGRSGPEATEDRLNQAEKKAQRAESENEQLRRILDNVPSGIGVSALSGKRAGSMVLNRYLTDMLGISESDAGDAVPNLLRLIHPEDRDRCAKDIHRFLSEGSELRGTYRFRRENAQDSFWVRVEGRLVRQPSGGGTAYLSYTDVNELKQTETALRSSWRAYEAAVRATDITVWEYDIANHRILLSDDEGSRQDMASLALPRVIENVPESLLRAVDEQDRAQMAAMYREVAAGRDAACELWTKPVRAHEESRCYRVFYTVERDQSGRAARAYGMRQDITAQKRAQERYEQELANLRTTESINLIAKGRHNLTQNKVLEYVPMNRKAHEIPSDQTYDDACAAFSRMPYLESDRKRLAELVDRNHLIRAYRLGETHFSFQYCRIKEAQIPNWVTTVINTYLVPSTGDIECFMYSYDVTEKILKDQILSRLTKLGYDELGLIYPKTGACTAYRVDFSGERAAEHAGNYAFMLEKLSGAFFLPERRESARRALSVRTITGKLRETGVYSYSFAMRRDNGDLRYKQFQFSWLDESRNTVFYCLSDITKQTAEEQRQIAELQAAKLEADRASEAKSMFLSSMSHDLRTPLNGVIGFTDLALRESDAVKRQEYLSKIKLSGELLLNLVNDTLELSRIESGKMVLEPEVTDSRQLGEAVVSALRPTAELRGVRLESDPSRFPQEAVWVDRLKVQKIFLNLLSNAIKFTPAGGTVRASIESLCPPVNGCNHRIVVADTGVGISPEFLPNIFEPFSQEHRQSNVSTMGTGLGLTIVKRIVDLMGGSIRVESVVGQGTRFTVDLPIRRMESPLSPPDENPVRQISLAGKVVLLCEDNYLNTEIATTLLKEKGVLATCAVNGKDGVAAFAASSPGHYDAVLMDIRMPIMDGYEAAAAIRSLPRRDAKTVPILALTADAFEEDIRRAKDAGMNDYITKPIEPERLFTALRSAIRKPHNPS